ncbi:MAG TPA: amidase, partial [Edaphobacter sp.]
MSDPTFSFAASRRRFLGVCSALGLGQTLLPGVLWGMAAQAPAASGGDGKTEAPALPKITPEMIDAAAAIAGVSLTAEQKTMMLDGLTKQRDSVMAIRSLKLQNSVAPAFVFDPVLPGMRFETERKLMRVSAAPDVSQLASAGVSDGLAFASVRELAELVKTRKVTSLELTKMYVARLKQYDPQL